jgi:hypothetical protein
MQLRHRPVASIQQLTVTSSDGSNVYNVPLNWIETALLHQGQINILPITISARDNQYVPLLAGPGGSAFLAIFSGRHWLPSFWQAVYTTGFKDGVLPKLVNQLIGVVAAMEVLSALAATHAKNTSVSLGIDGLSQSMSGPGPELYRNRLMELAEKRRWLKTRLQSTFGMGLILGNV